MVLVDKLQVIEDKFMDLEQRIKIGRAHV